MWLVWTVLAWVIYMECTYYDSKRARAPQISFYLLGRRRDAMRQWLKKRLSELLYARARLKCHSRAQWRGDWTPVCSEGLTASQSAPNGSYGPYGHGTCMGNA